MSSFPEEAFRRTDEAPDEEFYRTRGWSRT